MRLLLEKGAYPENLHVSCCLMKTSALFKKNYLCVLTLFQNAGSQFSKLFSLFMCVCVCVCVCLCSLSCQSWVSQTPSERALNSFNLQESKSTYKFLWRDSNTPSALMERLKKNSKVASTLTMPLGDETLTALAKHWQWSKKPVTDVSNVQQKMTNKKHCTGYHADTDVVHKMLWDTDVTELIPSNLQWKWCLSSFFLNWPFFVNILLNPSSTENGLSYRAVFHRKWPVSVKQSTEPVCSTAKANGYKFRNANKGKKRRSQISNLLCQRQIKLHLYLKH